jgi:hypothetical protein
MKEMRKLSFNSPQVRVTEKNFGFRFDGLKQTSKGKTEEEVKQNYASARLHFGNVRFISGMAMVASSQEKMDKIPKNQ